MPLKNFIKDYLSFSRKERIGLLAMLTLIILIYLLPRLMEREKPFPIGSLQVLGAAIDSQQTRESGVAIKNRFNLHPSPVHASFSNGILFSFDPNQLPAEGWKKLGLNDKTIRTIEKYRSKGGRFYKTEDLKKIWGMPEGFYERVKEYVVLEKQKQSESGWKGEKKDLRISERKIASISINEADTAAWIALPGIGSKLASRIVNFREKLGGFYSVEQVSETFGLADSTFQKIKPYLRPGGELKKININTATKEELKAHPYIRWNLANAIIEYRNQHGKYPNIESVKNITLISEDVFLKIAPYLKTE
jgi:competence protein ComEA